MTSKNTYFLKEYKLMIHNIILDDELRARYKSKKCAFQKQIKIRDSIAINQVFDISVLDQVNQQTQETDNQVFLDLSNFINGKNYDVASIKFDMTKQKILAPSSTNFFTAKLENSNQQQNFSGIVQYKFVGLKKRQILQQQVNQLQKTKIQVQKKDELLNQHQELKRMAQILQERNHVVLNELQTNQNLIKQIKKLKQEKIKQRHQGRSGSLGKDAINFNVNVNATAHEKMIIENKALIDQNYNLKADIDKLQIDVQALQNQLKFYKQESNLYKKQLQRKQGQPSIFINQPSYRLQNLEHQQKELQNKSKMADSIYEGGLNANTPRNNQRRRKTSFNRNASQQLKSSTKSELEKSLNKQKDHKIQEIDKKIKHYEALYKKAIQEEGYVPKALSQKVSYLQQKMRNFELGQMGYISKQASLKLKQTISKLTQDLKSKQIQCDELKKSVGKRSYLDGSMYGANQLQLPQRKTVFQQMTKSRQIYTKSVQDLKKINSELMKQRSTLQIQNQNSKFRQQKLILKHQERQRQLQRVAKKSNDQNNKKINDLTRNLEKRSDQVIKLNYQKEELKENLNNCIAELNSLGQILQKMQKQNLLLQDQNQQQKTRIQKYEQAQKVLLKQVQQIKKQAQFNEKQFRVLLQERNEAFIKIQRIKDTQIEKLKKVIQQCQYKIQQQISQVLTLKKQQQKNLQTINTLSSQLQQSRTNCEVTSQNYQKEVEDTILKINTLQDQNDQLQTNLIEYAQKIRQHQFAYAQSQIKLESYKMQVQALEGLKVQMKQLQSKFIKQKKSYLEIIEQQTQKFKQIQQKYEQLETVVGKEQKQNQQVRILNFKLIEQVQEFRRKYQNKAEEVISIKSQKADVEIALKQAISKQGNLVQQIHKLKQTIESKDSEVEQLNQRISELQSTIKDNSKNSNLNVNSSKNQDMRSSNVTKFDKSRVKNDMTASRMKKSTVKQMEKSVKFKESQVKNKFTISQAQSLRGTQIKENLEDDFQQQKLPKITIPQQILRQRMFTLHEQQQQHENGSGHQWNNKTPHQSSNVHIEVDELQSDELESEVSARERQFQTFNPRKMQTQSGQMSQSIENDQPRWRNAESQSQSFINLKSYEDKIALLQLQNQRLKKQLEQKINECNEYRQQNLLKSALGITSGIFLNNQNQRKRSEQIRIQERKSVAKSPSPNYSSKQSSPDVSRQGSIYNASQNPNEKSQLLVTNLNLFKKSSIARSSVQGPKQRHGSIESDRNNIRQIQQRNRDLQLQLQEISNQNHQLRSMYQQQKQNVDKIYGQLQKMVQTQQQLRNQLQAKNQQTQDLQAYYEDVKSQMQKKLEELIQQQLEKQTSQLNALKQLNKKEEIISQLQKKVLQLEQKIKQQKALLIIKQAQIQKMKEQYRKYEEQSELQILNLKQLVDHQVKQIGQKTKEVQLIAEDYIQLKDQIKLLQIDSMNKDVLIQKFRNSSDDAKDQLNKTFDNYRNLENSRKELNLKNFKLEEQLAMKENEISQITKKSVMTIKKFQIRIQTFQQQKLALQQKICQKDQMNQTLKQQIALYNSQTYELKQLNNQLTLQIEKTQKQLKDIMYSYQKEFSSVSHEKGELDEALNYYKTLSKQKDDEIANLNKKIYKLEEEYRYANNEVLDVKQNYQKYKNSKQKQINEHYLELQLKTDQYQKLKKIHQRQSEQYFTKQSQYLSKIEQFTRSSKQYKEKLKKYQQTLEQLEKELLKLSQRPTKQQFQQLQFQSQLFKNRIQQLQQHLKDTVNNANHQQQYYNQFRKYKTHKQRQLNDLQNQLEKYSTKFSQLQQSNYHLKKQIEKLRHQIQKLVEQRDIITQQNYDLKQDLEQIKGEMEFYKGRRIQNLSKLLNDTM